MAKEYPLSLVIRAVDKATAPLREINRKLAEATAPVRRLNNSLKALSAEAGFPKLTKSIGGAWTALRGVASEAFALGAKFAALGAAAAFGLYRIVRGAVDAGDKLGEMSTRVGLSVDAYAQLQHSAAQADVEQESFNSALDQFNRRLGEAKAGGGALLGFLDKVAPALGQQVKAAASTEDALGLMFDAFERLKDPAKVAALSSAAFGKSGLQMGVWAQQGRKGIAAGRAEFAALNPSMAEFVENAGKLDNAMRRTEVAFKGSVNTVVSAFTPALLALAQAITDVIGKNREGLVAWAERTSAAVKKWVDEDGVGKLVAQVKALGEWIDNLVDKLGGLKGVLLIVAAVMSGSLVMSIFSAIGALWNLGAAVAPLVARAFMALVPAVASAGSALFTMIMGINVTPILALAGSIGTAAAAVGSFMLAAAPFIAAVVAVGAAGYAVYKNWEPLKELFSDIGQLWGAIKETFGNPLESLKYAGRWWGKELGLSGPSGQPLGAAAAAPGAPGKGGDARVTVDFSNVPKGARVLADPRGTAPLDLSVGYAMQGAN